MPNVNEMREPEIAYRQKMIDLIDEVAEYPEWPTHLIETDQLEKFYYALVQLKGFRLS